MHLYFSCEKLLGNIQLWFVLRHTEKWKEEFRKCVRKHWEEYKDAMLRSFVSCRVLEKEEVGKRKWEEDERQRKERRKEIHDNLVRAFQEATAREAANEQEAEKEQEREREAEKEQEREHEAEKEQEKEHETEKDQEKEQEAEKEQEKDKEAEKEQEKEESKAWHQLSVIIAEVITF